MKEKIRKGEFIPNVTNSWSNSKVVCNINEKEIKFRSTWEAFFNIVNPNLIYEKIIIPYIFKGENHNYIVDFVDYDNKQIYEVKPNSEKIKEKNIIKREYAIKWCEKNNYHYNIIDDEWFNVNFIKYKHLLKEYDDKICKNLKQFEK